MRGSCDFDSKLTRQTRLDCPARTIATGFLFVFCRLSPALRRRKPTIMDSSSRRGRVACRRRREEFHEMDRERASARAGNHSPPIGSEISREDCLTSRWHTGHRRRERDAGRAREPAAPTHAVIVQRGAMAGLSQPRCFFRSSGKRLSSIDESRAGALAARGPAISSRSFARSAAVA